LRKQNVNAAGPKHRTLKMTEKKKVVSVACDETRRTLHTQKKKNGVSNNREQTITQKEKKRVKRYV
jgi:hypothetical protein